MLKSGYLVCGLLILGGGLGGMAMWLGGRRPNGWANTVSPKDQARMTIPLDVALRKRLVMHRVMLATGIFGIIWGTITIALVLTW